MKLCEIDKDGEMTNSYIYADGQILAKCDHTGASVEDYFYITDRQGSVRVIADDGGAAQVSYTYDPFGVVIEENGTFANPFKFTGQWYDEEIDQYYLRARMYDPRLMRFTGYDPVRGKASEPMTLHRYLYCTNNPVNKIDPKGNFAILVGMMTNSAASLPPALGYGQTVMIQQYYGLTPDLEFFCGTLVTAASPMLTQSNLQIRVGLEISLTAVLGYSPNAKSGKDLSGYSRDLSMSIPWGGMGRGLSFNKKGIIVHYATFGFSLGAEARYIDMYSWDFGPDAFNFIFGEPKGNIDWTTGGI